MKKNILGHRGYSEIAPENTDLAFEAALLYNFDGVELDVHMTKDGELVIIHDETVDRTSDGTGSIEDMTLDELMKLNFAYKYNSDMAPQKIMTYEKFLRKYGNEFKVINTEIKTDINNYEGIEQKIWEIHKEINPKAKIIYSSFNFNTLKRLKQIAPEAIIGYLFSKHSDFDKYEEEVLNICDYIHPSYKLLSDSKYIGFPNIKINIWTIDLLKNSKNEIEKFKNTKEIWSLISNSKI